MIFSKLSLIWHKLATSVVFLWLTPPSNAGVVGSIPGLGTKIPHMGAGGEMQPKLKNMVQTL